MSRIVYIRHERMAAACARPDGCAEEAASMRSPERDGAEIILFPLVHRAYAGRARKRLTRRLQTPAKLAK